MTLSVSKSDIDALAQALHAAGVIFKIGYRGPEVVYSDAADHRAIEAMGMLLEALRVVRGRDGKRQFLELVEEAVKALATAADKAPKPAPKKPKGKAKKAAPDSHTVH